MCARSRYAFKQSKKNQAGLKKSLVHRPMARRRSERALSDNPRRRQGGVEFENEKIPELIEPHSPRVASEEDVMTSAKMDACCSRGDLKNAVPAGMKMWTGGRKLVLARRRPGKRQWMRDTAPPQWRMQWFLVFRGQKKVGGRGNAERMDYTKAERMRCNGVGTDRQRPVVTSQHRGPSRVEEGKMSGSKEKDGQRGRSSRMKCNSGKDRIGSGNGRAGVVTQA
ncbi:hypothetical protein B0H13DRAFT_1866074 [Mycena leptocephala]|nr:hypothetical protein B0H13DRAFT_1866074 [Mycena leptocephala]